MNYKDLSKSLMFRLIVGSLGIIAAVVGAAFAAAKGTIWLVIVLAIIAVSLVVVINLWFRRDLILPIGKLTDSARRIAEGSYGTQCLKADDNELGRLTDEINEMSEKIALNDKMRTEFISQVSHELRTPLTAITGWSETIAFDPAIPEESMKGIKIISREAARLTSMVEELLEFTRIQDGRFNLRVELVDIASELEDALFTYSELIRQSGMAMNYEPPENEIPLIPGDPERLKQVFLNVLDNAITHGVDGSSIDISLAHDGEFVHIAIRDHGRGVPAGELPHIKERFYKGSSKDRGNGIGLSVCDEIITRHGGELTIENAPGGGCLVTITLPMAQN